MRIADLPIRYRFLLLLAATLALLAVTGLLGVLGQSEVESQWTTYQDRVARRRELLLSMKGALGYAGGIHHFKNYVLRAREDYHGRARADFTRFARSLEGYEALPDLTLQEQESLSILEATVEAYDRGLDITRQKVAAGASVDQIDDAVKVDDGPATRAFAQLEAETARLVQQQRQALERALWRNEVVLVSGLAAVFVLLASCQWLIARSIVGPVEAVTRAARRLAGGDLRDYPLNVHSKDEVGRLAEAFRQMAAGLRKLTRQTADVTLNLASAAQELVACTQQQAASTGQQAATIQNLASTMEELTESGAQTTARASRVAVSAEDASKASQAGLEAVSATQQAVDSLREQVEGVTSQILQLSGRTDAIGEIVASVTEMAEMSNLLALNASIEAASAGDDGLRFGVVAAEMKSLAEQSKAATRRVRSILGDIQERISSSVFLTEEAVKRTDAGGRQAALTEDVIRGQAATIEESLHAFQQIIAATNQGQIGLEQLEQGMREIGQATEEMVAQNRGVEEAAAGLHSLSQQLERAVGAYRLD